MQADYDVDQTLSLTPAGLNQRAVIRGQQIVVDQVQEADGQTFVTFTTEDSVVLSRVCLIADDRSVPLEEIIDHRHEKTSAGPVMHTRTMRFSGTGEELLLDIQRMTYAQPCHRTLPIPLD